MAKTKKHTPAAQPKTLAECMPGDRVIINSQPLRVSLHCGRTTFVHIPGTAYSFHSRLGSTRLDSIVDLMPRPNRGARKVKDPKSLDPLLSKSGRY